MEAIDIHQAQVGNLQVGNDRQRAERPGAGRAPGAGSPWPRLRRAGHRDAGPRSQTAPGSSGRRRARPTRPATRPPSTATNPPPSASRRLTATAMSSSPAPTTQMLWLSWPTEEASAPSAKAKALHEPAANIAVTAMALEHADLEQIVLRIGVPKAVAKGQIGL